MYTLYNIYKSNIKLSILKILIINVKCDYLGFKVLFLNLKCY